MSIHEETISETRRPVRGRWVLPLATGVAGLVVGVALTLGGVSLVTAAQSSAEKAQAVSQSAKLLSDAVKSCAIDDAANAQIGDGGYTLTVNNKGKEDFDGISYDDLACLQQALDTPQSVMSHLEQTTSMDGRQSETWGKVSESWSYHPDRGLDAVFTVERDR